MGMCCHFLWRMCKWFFVLYVTICPFIHLLYRFIIQFRVTVCWSLSQLAIDEEYTPDKSPVHHKAKTDWLEFHIQLSSHHCFWTMGGSQSTWRKLTLHSVKSRQNLNPWPFCNEGHYTPLSSLIKYISLLFINVFFFIWKSGVIVKATYWLRLQKVDYNIDPTFQWSQLHKYNSCFVKIVKCKIIKYKKYENTYKALYIK